MAVTVLVPIKIRVLAITLSALLLFSVLGCSLLSSRLCGASGRLGKGIELVVSPLLPLVRKDVIVRSVIFDERGRGGHLNASVFMVEARRDIFNEDRIIGCQVGSHFGSFLKVRPDGALGFSMHWKQWWVDHDMLVVDCFDVPAESGDRAFLFYKDRPRDGVERVYSVESERLLYVPPPRVSYKEDEYRVAVCLATARYSDYDNRLTANDMVYHWLTYQRRLGVDHIHITAHPSFLEVGSFQNDVIRKGLQDNFISMEVWEPWLNETDNYHAHSQLLAYHDCAYRMRLTYDYVVICDSDDFFVPRLPGETSLGYYLQHWCPHGACRFRWIERYPDCGLEWDHLTSDGNLTDILSSQTYFRLLQTKSVYKSGVVLDIGVHLPMSAMSGYSVVFVPHEVAYFAHMRQHRMPSEKGNSC